MLLIIVLITVLINDVSDDIIRDDQFLSKQNCFEKLLHSIRTIVLVILCYIPLSSLCLLYVFTIQIQVYYFRGILVIIIQL